MCMYWYWYYIKLFAIGCLTLKRLSSSPSVMEYVSVEPSGSIADTVATSVSSFTSAVEHKLCNSDLQFVVHCYKWAVTAIQGHVSTGTVIADCFTDMTQ